MYLTSFVYDIQNKSVNVKKRKTFENINAINLKLIRKVRN